MTRYADRAACPDCRGAIAPTDDLCPRCGLPVTGPRAAELFATLTRADQLLFELRQQVSPLPPPQLVIEPPAASAASSVPVGMPAPTAATRSPAAGELPAYPTHTAPGRVGPPLPEPRRPAIQIKTVPAILVTVGALCLLIGGGIFLAVAWSVLGVAGRTTVLVLFTLAIGAVGMWAAGRRMRAAAESLLVLAHGLLAFDLLGATSAGWFGSPTGWTTSAYVGAVTGSAAVAVTLVARPSIKLVGTQIVAAVGLFLATVGLFGPLDIAPASATAVLITLGVALVARTQLPVLAWGSAGVSVIWGLVLLGWTSSDLTTWDERRLTSQITIARMWGDFHAWPLLFLISVTAGLALIRWLPSWTRVGAAFLAVSLATYTIVLPVTDNGTPAATATLLGLGALTVGLAPLVGRRWGPSGLVPLLTPAIAGGLTAVTNALEHAAVVSVRLSDEVFSAPLDARLHGPTPSAGTPMLLVSVTLLSVAVWLGLKYVNRDLLPSTSDRATCAALVAAITVAAVIAGYGMPRWTVVAVLLAIAVAWAAIGVAETGWLPVAAAAGVVSTIVALPSQALTVIAVATVTATAAAVDLLGRTWSGTTARRIASAYWLVGLVTLLWTAFDLADIRTSITALIGIGLFGVIAACWRRHLVFEIVGWLCTPVSFLPPYDNGTDLAIRLTLLGAMLALAAILHSDRREVGWLASAAFTLALWVRLADQGVTTPEWYTLPVATGLVVFGLVQMRRTTRPSLQLLAPALGVGLTPSLLVVLGDPVSTRALILGMAATAILLAGVVLKWEAPTLAGATTVSAIAIIEGLHARVLPQWWALSLVGAGLLAVGVTWEFWLTRARVAVAWVRQMR